VSWLGLNWALKYACTSATCEQPRIRSLCRSSFSLFAITNSTICSFFFEKLCSTMYSSHSFPTLLMCSNAIQLFPPFLTSSLSPSLALSSQSQGTLPPALSSSAPPKLSTSPTPLSVDCTSALLFRSCFFQCILLLLILLLLPFCFCFQSFMFFFHSLLPLLFSSAPLLPMHFASTHTLVAAVLFLLSIFHVLLSFAVLLPCSSALLLPMHFASTHTLFVSTLFVFVPTISIFENILPASVMFLH